MAQVSGGKNEWTLNFSSLRATWMSPSAVGCDRHRNGEFLRKRLSAGHSRGSRSLRYPAATFGPSQDGVSTVRWLRRRPAAIDGLEGESSRGPRLHCSEGPSIRLAHWRPDMNKSEGDDPRKSLRNRVKQSLASPWFF